MGFGAEAGLSIIKTMRDSYNNKSFIMPSGEMDTTPCVEYQTKVLEGYGLVNNNQKQIIENVLVFPTEYFCPMHYLTGVLSRTENTYSIHHYESTHWDKKAKDGMFRIRKAYDKYGKIGGNLYSRSRILRGIDIFFSEGIAGLKGRIK